MFRSNAATLESNLAWSDSGTATAPAAACPTRDHEPTALAPRAAQKVRRVQRMPFTVVILSAPADPRDEGVRFARAPTRAIHGSVTRDVRSWSRARRRVCRALRSPGEPPATNAATAVLGTVAEHLDLAGIARRRASRAAHRGTANLREFAQEVLLASDPVVGSPIAPSSGAAGCARVPCGFAPRLAICTHGGSAAVPRVRPVAGRHGDGGVLRAKLALQTRRCRQRESRYPEVFCESAHGASSSFHGRT